MNVRAFLSIAALALTFAFTSDVSSQTYTLGFDQTGYNINPGTTVDLTLILTEDISGGGTSRLAPGGDDGLFAFGAGINYSSFTGTGGGSTFNSLIFNSEFLQSDPDFTKISDDGSVVSFETSETSGSGISGTMISASEYTLELATITFNAGDAGTNTTLQLQVGELPITNPFLFADGANPTVGFGSSQIIVNAVPEPGSAAILILVAGAGLLKRRRN